jgi:hypothetical protein
MDERIGLDVRRASAEVQADPPNLGIGGQAAEALGGDATGHAHDGVPPARRAKTAAGAAKDT